MSRTRRPAVAGSFYPADAPVLRADVDRMLDTADVTVRPAPIAAMIVPHAGYVYSGPIAAAAYRQLRDGGQTPTTVVVAGPNHTMRLDRIAVSAADVWRTPLGDVPVDSDLRDTLVAEGLAEIEDAPHRREHGIEVHLPFLQRALSAGWRLLPAVVGRVTDELSGAFVDHCWAQGRLVVISSDLSHYLSYDEARRVDDATIAAIVAGDTSSVRPDRACGAFPVRALLASDLATSLVADVVAVGNSGDTAGPRDRVVGYGALTYSIPTKLG